MLTVFEAIKQLQITNTSILMLLSDIQQEQARWKPDAQSWSMLEVINHLADEECDDFRLRLQMTLFHNEDVLPPIDPEGWVTARSYNTQEFQESVARFQNERQNSLKWLETLQVQDWTVMANHPNLQGLRAGDLLASWVGHDLLHLRQLTELRWKYLDIQADPYSADYAGSW